MTLSDDARSARQMGSTGGATLESEKRIRSRLKRRTVLKLGAMATAAVGAAIGVPKVETTRTVAAHNLPPDQFGSPTYDAVLRADGGVKGIFQSPHVEAAVPAGKVLNHLLLVQLKNWLNGFEFSYQMAPGDLHTVVATYASANLFTYADAAWERYRLGEKYGLTDPETGAPATRNVFWSSRFGLDASRDPENPQGFYQDVGIEALQQRGTVFLT